MEITDANQIKAVSYRYPPYGEGKKKSEGKKGDPKSKPTKTQKKGEGKKKEEATK